MKRLFAVLLTVILLVTPTAAFAKSKAVTLNTKSIVGMSEKKLVQAYGKPARKDASEYGFTWYVYNKDYKNFFMAGVRNDKVVAVYTNAAGLKYGSKIKLNTTRTAARKALGTPTTMLQNGNTFYMIYNATQRDFFTVGSNYVIVFYDTLKGNKTTAILIVPKADENNALLNKPALSSAVQRAYEKESVDLTNAIRVRNGLKALKTNADNTELARLRSKDMVKRNYFSHYTPAPEKKNVFQIAKSMGVKYTSMGENIAFGNHNAIFAQESFMNSSGHRSNLLRSKYTKVGSGVAYGGSRYVLVTNIFSK